MGGQARAGEREHQSGLQKTLHGDVSLWLATRQSLQPILETMACGIGTRFDDFNTWMH
jgi:hypothetical protein